MQQSKLPPQRLLIGRKHMVVRINYPPQGKVVQPFTQKEQYFL